MKSPNSKYSSSFQLTTSRRGRPELSIVLWNLRTFQLTTSRRGRQTALRGAMWTKAFQLTTSRRGRPDNRKDRRNYKNFNSLPHAEVDCNMSVACISRYHFNSLPHAEVDCMAQNYPGQEKRAFQLTTSRRGRPSPVRSQASFTPFQLTTSRRGRQKTASTIYVEEYFNSLPHAEVDNLKNCFFSELGDFNSLPHAEVDSS